MSKVLPSSIFALALLAPSTALANTYNYCIWTRFALDDKDSDYPGADTDTGTGTLIAPPGLPAERYIPMRDSYYEIWNTHVSGNWFLEKSGYTNGTDGCTGSVSGINFNQKHRILFKPVGYADSNILVRGIDYDETIPSYWTTEFTSNQTNNSKVNVFQTVDLNYPRIHALLTWIINKRFRGHLANISISAHYYENTGPCETGGPHAVLDEAPSYAICFGQDQLSWQAVKRRFVIAHEYGHINIADTAAWSFDCSLGSGGSGFHSMRSLEYQSCAFSEGWAHFVAARAYNNATGTNPGGDFILWADGPVIDIDFGNPSSYQVDYCGTEYYTAGNCPNDRGVELDWMRMFWDYHTNNVSNNHGSPPSISQMQYEIDAAPNWAQSHHRIADNLNSGILSYSGQEQSDRFEEMCDANGINGY